MKTMTLQEVMNSLAVGVDRILNGENVEIRKNGFVLLVFPFGDKSGGSHYISNGTDRKDIIKRFEEQIKKLKELET
jgi:hypothetical protein